MPWHIAHQNGKYCVVKDDNGESAGCHPTRQEAVAQLRALYASETGGAKDDGKELTEVEVNDMDKSTWEAAYVNNLPDSAFLYVESGGEKDDEGKTTPRSLRHLPYKDSSGAVDLPHLRNAISRLGQSGTGGGADGWLTDSVRKRLLGRARALLAKHQKSLFDRAVDWLKAAVGVDEPEPEPESVNRFLVWKQADDTMRWLAIYSNRYRDRDHPPEILSEAAHRDFVDAVEKGDWPMPTLRVWHVKGADVGRADWLAYDDRGFSLASGTVRPEVGERLALRDDLGTSHGMPSKEIQRDGEDPSIITRYRSAEISVLPAWAAANELTGFFIPKENDMAIPEEKKAFLAEVLPENVLADLDAALDAKAKQAEGLEFKDAPEQPAPEPVSEVKEPEAPEPVVAPAPAYMTEEQVAEAVGTLLGELTGRIEGLASAVDQITIQFKEMSERFEAMQKDDDERIAKAAELTPAASLAALMRQYSVVGKPETKVDGRSELAKSKPAENASAASKGPTVVPFINELIQRQGTR
jgi:hypothetical protein